MKRITLLLTAGAVIAAIVTQAFGGPTQRPPRDGVREKAIIDGLQKVAPKAVKDFESGTTAMDNEDYSGGAMFYQLVLDRAPDFNPAIRRLGICLTESGHQAEGIQLLRRALAQERSPENLYSLAVAMVYPGKDAQGKEIEATREDKAQALNLAIEARKSGGDDVGYLVLIAELSLGQSEANFRDATAALVKMHPELMQTHYFNAMRAAMDEEWVTAEDEIKTAGKMGLPQEAVDKFLDSGVHSNAAGWRYGYYALYLFAAWILGLVLLFVFGKLLSSLTLRSIEVDDPNDGDSRKHVLLRRCYRALINAGGFYYYISMPFVMILVVAIAGSVVYACWEAGRFPIKLIVVIVVGALATCYGMIQSLLVRRKHEDPGRPLRFDEAPGLWNMAREIARKVGTRAVAEIRVTPGTELAVYETGSFKDRSRDNGHRVLILGVGLLNGFTQNSFRAVLAHEYGHLTHRDTAGGDVALRVNQNMMQFAVAMVQAGQAVWWNLAFQFLKVYHFIFRRLSYGATRLQEVLADRVAVSHYGAAAFEEGLRHVVRRGIEFEDAAYRELTAASNTKRVLQNLYELEPSGLRSVEDKVRESINRPTTEDNTHPGPLDRFRYARRIISRIEEPAPGMVWDLFLNKQSLTSEMSAAIGKRLSR